MNKKKTIENYLIIGFAVILLIIVFIIVYIASTSNRPPDTDPTREVPLPTIPAVSLNSALLNPGSPPISYDDFATDQLIKKVKETPTLIPEDIVAKEKIIKTLPSGQKSGYVYRSSTIRVEYLPTPDLFVVEIVTTDIKTAKSDANTWFRTQGLSQKAICDIPVSFYLNWDIAQQLRNSTITFSPLPNGC